MTPIADMVERMLSGGIPPEFIVLAVRTAEQTARDSMPVDVTAERRRAWDRQRKASKKASSGIPPEKEKTDIVDITSPYESQEGSARKNGTSGGAKKSILPDDWQPDREFARARGWSETRIDGEVQRFRDHAASNGRKAVKWDAAWRNWVTSPYQKGPLNGNRLDTSPRSAPTHADAIVAGMARVAARRGHFARSADGTNDGELFGSDDLASRTNSDTGATHGD